MNRLFISTKEAYCPSSIIVSANLIFENHPENHPHYMKKKVKKEEPVITKKSWFKKSKPVEVKKVEPVESPVEDEHLEPQYDVTLTLVSGKSGGHIATSSKEEGLWFVENIFRNITNQNYLIMDYTKKTVETCIEVPIDDRKVCDDGDEEDDTERKEDRKPSNSIEYLDVKE